jgi:succinate dehydrogenase / fumarate reductase iron-sulfur subunit
MTENAQATLKIFRGDREGGEFREYAVPLHEGMVVLDAVHHVQAHLSTDLACRWNCKAGKCGSCSAEVNGKPRLMCMARMDQFPAGEPITIAPMKSFPVLKDLVCDVSWNYEVNRRMPAFRPRPPDQDGSWRMQQDDIDRVQEFRKCIECFLCQDVCHVLRDHEGHESFIGPRFLVRAASLEMHPLDTTSRTAYLKDEGGIGYCNITKCCTEVCPESIHITDNAIIPLKERVVDDFYDPLRRAWRWLRGGGGPA